MKHVLMILAVTIGCASSTFASDLNNCGPDYQRWMSNVRSLKNSLYMQAGVVVIEGKGEISTGAIEMYLKSCRHASENIRSGGCYDSLIKKDVFPTTVSVECEDFVEKLQKF